MRPFVHPLGLFVLLAGAITALLVEDRAGWSGRAPWIAAWTFAGYAALVVAQLIPGRRSSKVETLSQVIPSPGTQVIIWNVTDPDGDNLLNTFSVRRDGDSKWTDIVAASKDNYAQFDTKHLPDGVYFTRLVATESSPRPVESRLSQTFETDDLIVDHTPPELVDAKAERSGNSVIVTVQGRDRLSLLEGIEVVFNNNVRETIEQPADGVRDGREETFKFEVPLARVSNATSVEVTLYDASGNGTAKRLNW